MRNIHGHNVEFAKNPLGDEVFAVITEEQAQAINAGHQAIRNAMAGPVKVSILQIVHIWIMPDRKKQIEDLGFKSPEKFLYKVGQMFTEIYDTGINSIGLVYKQPDHAVIWVNLIVDTSEPMWMIGSAAPCAKDKFKKKKLLWPVTQPNGLGAGHPSNFSPTHVNKNQTVEGAGLNCCATSA